MSVRTRRRRLAVVLVGLSAVGLAKAGAFDGGLLFGADKAEASQKSGARPPLHRPDPESAPAPAARKTPPPASRLAGATPYDTAVAVTRAAFPAGVNPGTVYLTTSASWAAAVAAGPAAAADVAPALASILVYVLMAGVLFWKPEGLFVSHG